jgi:TolA-binding protein
MLKPRKRLTKKQLKEDKLLTFYVKVSKWYETYSKFVLGGGVAIVLIIAAGLYYKNSTRKAESAASVELARAIRVYDAEDYQNSIAMLSSLVDGSGNTRSGKIALLYLANSFYKTGDYDHALNDYKKFVAKFDKIDYFTAFAMGSMASCLEQKGDFAAAAAQYEKTASKFPKQYLAPAYLFRAARCYSLADNNVEASTLYQKIIDDYPNSQQKEDAIMEKALL